MAGQAKRRGTFEQRKAQAIAAGRAKKRDRQDPPQLDALPKPIDEPTALLCAGASPQYMQAMEHILELSKRGVVIIGPVRDHRGLVGRPR